jgi:hypothetical protein
VQDRPNFTQIRDFWFENKPSGSPGFGNSSSLLKESQCLVSFNEETGSSKNVSLVIDSINSILFSWTFVRLRCSGGQQRRLLRRRKVLNRSLENVVLLPCRE